MSLRTNCVICSTDLTPLYIRKNFPISISPPKPGTPFRMDNFSDQTFSSCPNCSCVQLSGNLIDPAILYANPHNNTGNTPTWKLHHETFSKFVLNTLPKKVIEVGGTGTLYACMKEETPDIPYSSLDICSPTKKLPGVTYLQGNCETFDFTGHSTVVMSHVFEHLYNPCKFIENLSNAAVEHVIISIPNMKAMLDVNNINILHNEHTYYVDRLFAEYIFSKYNYKLTLANEFKDHSLFFHFTLTKDTEYMKNQLAPRPEIPERMFDIYSREKERLSNILIKENSFIAPAGLYGQLLHYFSKPDTLLGYLDNDTAKQGVRVYGTPYYVFPFDSLKNHKRITIYLWGGPYKEELLKQLQTYNISVEIIDI
jgi:hypothetical protein